MLIQFHIDAHVTAPVVTFSLACSTVTHDKLFQTRGAATEKRRLPNFVLQ